MTCDIQEKVNAALKRILTQYRESPKLIAMISHDVAEIANVICLAQDALNNFDIENAVGDQLTIIGKLVGMQRCHCVCDELPTFGFNCDGDTSQLGFCEESVWAGCTELEATEICINDDDTFRNYIYAKIYQNLRLYTIDYIEQAVKIIWGSSANIQNMQDGKVAVVTGRELTALEKRYVPIAMRVLPIAPGITKYFYESSGAVFGFGTGWGGFCENSQWFCPEPYDALSC